MIANSIQSKGCRIIGQMVIINYYQILGGDPYAGIFKVIKIMEEVVSLLSFQCIDKVIWWEKKRKLLVVLNT